MPDLSMCQDHACPSAKKCYRHEAKQSGHQSYTDWGRKMEDESCEAFIGIIHLSRSGVKDIERF